MANCIICRGPLEQEPSVQSWIRVFGKRYPVCQKSHCQKRIERYRLYLADYPQMGNFS